MGSAAVRPPNIHWIRNIFDLQQITRHISKMVQGRHVVSVKDEQEVVYTLLNGDIADKLG